MQELKRDRCLKCAEPTEHGYVFCEKCTPRYGQTTRIFSNELQKKGMKKIARANETSPGFELNHKHVLLVLLGFLMLFFS